ncbi:MAG TPA: dienelactone hydrolase family protein, partial [Arenibaculum sp.]|nr:dienelactone hydrolase family protein [Arenibaculum sp.]
SDPADFAEILDGTARPRAVPARLYLPPRPAGGGRMPAVVLVPDTDGPDERALMYAGALTAAGIATLVPEAATATAGRGRDAARSALPGQLADALAAWRFLADDPRFDAGRIGIMGMASGGSAATLAAHVPFVRAAAGEHAAFAAHLPLYPACEFRMSHWQVTGAPVLMVLAEEDAVGAPAECVPVAEALSAAGNAVATKIYSGAHHAFDRGAGIVVRQDVHAVGACRSVIDGAGRTSLSGGGVPADSVTAAGDWADYRRTVLARCGKAGVKTGADLDLRGNVAADVAAFFRETLKPGAFSF